MKTKGIAILTIALLAGSLGYAEARANPARANAKAVAARAQVLPRTTAAERTPESPTVDEWGKYQGQDPDANVRLMLRRDYHN